MRVCFLILGDSGRQKALLRRTQSHPNPRSSGSTFETVPHDQHKRVNLNMISRPVLVPEGREDFEKLEEDEKYDHKQDKVFTRRVVHAVGKNFGREKKKKVKDGVVVFKGHPSWSIVLAFQVGRGEKKGTRRKRGKGRTEEKKAFERCSWGIGLSLRLHFVDLGDGYQRLV